MRGEETDKEGLKQKREGRELQCRNEINRDRVEVKTEDREWLEVEE